MTLVLPIALPGIVTAIALSSAINFGHDLFGLTFSIWTIIVGHATFCIVVVFNNIIARLRRTPAGPRRGRRLLLRRARLRLPAGLAWR